MASIVWVAVNVQFHGGILSVFDEWVYLDYLDKLPAQPYVHQGERVGPWSRELMSCFGIERTGPLGDTCGGDYANYGSYPQAAISSGSGYPPLFFWITWAVSRVFLLIPGVDPLGSYRLTGMIWLVPTALVVFAVLQRFELPTGLSLSAALLFITSPFSWWAYTFVSTDAPVPLLGALALLVVQRAVSGHGRLWPLVAIGFAGGMLKLTAAMGVALATVVLLVFLLRERRRREPGGKLPSLRAAFGASALALAAGVIPQMLWMAFAKATAVGPPAEQGVLLEAAQLPGALGKAVGVFLDDAFAVPSQLGVYSIPDPVSFGFRWAIIVGVIAAAMAARQGEFESSFTRSTAIAALTFGPLLLIALAAIGSAFPLPGRYAAALLPAFVAGSAIAANRGEASRRAAIVLCLALASAQLILAPLTA